MRRSGILISITVWLRKYAVALVLVAMLGVAMVQVHVFGVGPMPQQPPEGYTAVQTQVSLSWNRGTKETPITIQVSIDDPSFTKPMLERKVSGTSHSLSKLRGGSTYYWRLIQNGKPSPTASFKVSKYNVHI